MNNTQERQKVKQNFRNKILKHVELFSSAVSTGSASEYCVCPPTISVILDLLKGA